MVEVDNTNDISTFEQVQALIKGQVDDYLKEQQSIPTPQQQQSEQDKATQQIRDLINPFVKPDLDEARFVAADAKDFVSFYNNNEDALLYKDDVEKSFELMKKAGRPTTRADILNYLVGREYREQPDKFKERETAKQKRQVERADGAIDFGGGSINRAKSDPTWSNFNKLSIEDMEKALDGITF